MDNVSDALQEWELEDDYLRASCEPSYLTHPLWLEHQKKKPKTAPPSEESEAKGAVGPVSAGEL